MSNAWDYAKELAEKHDSAGGGLFVRLANDGDKVVGVFLGEPNAREVHWTGEKYEACGGEGCSYCESGKKPSLRVSMNFYVPAERALKVIEGGVVWFKDLLKVKEKYGLEKWQFEIERHGEAKSAKTTYSILPEEKIDAGLQKQLDKLELHDLESMVSGDDGDKKPEDGRAKDDDALIDPHVASSLIPRLKAMPRSAVDELLQKFDVDKVRDIKAAQTEAVIAFVDRLEAKYGQVKENDPFA